MKTCYICKRELPATLEYFGPQKNRLSGLRSECRECRRHPKKRVDDSQMKAHYRRIRVNGKSIPVCRYVLEQKLGRALSKGEHAHHINGNRYDDRPENLMVIDQSSHSRLHNIGKHHTQETRLKMSVSKTGYKYPNRKPMSPESNLRRSESMKRYRKLHPWSTKKK